MSTSVIRSYSFVIFAGIFVAFVWTLGCYFDSFTKSFCISKDLRTVVCESLEPPSFLCLLPGKQAMVARDAAIYWNVQAWEEMQCVSEKKERKRTDLKVHMHLFRSCRVLRTHCILCWNIPNSQLKALLESRTLEQKPHFMSVKLIFMSMQQHNLCVFATGCQ